MSKNMKYKQTTRDKIGLFFVSAGLWLIVISVILGILELIDFITK